MRKRFLLSLLVALLTTIATHAYTFKSGDLYYSTTSKNTVEVTYQDRYTSSNYKGLTTATIPETVTYNGTTYSVTSIGDYAFIWCSALTSITIPNSVKTIGKYAFNKVPNIVYSGTATGSPWGARSVNGYIDGYLVYADETKTTLLACSVAATGEITIPNSVTSIGEETFYGCSALTSITIPNSVTSIGSSAFRGCSSLTSIILPNSVTSIGEKAFYGCSALTSITIPNSVTAIGDYAFYGCSALTSITIPNSVTSIGWYAFMYCSALTSITIPNSVTSIGDFAFEDCYSLTSITIPNSVTSIGNYVFQRCYSLTSITIGNSVTSIGNYAFNDCSALTSITIGNSVTSIGDCAFYDCSSLTSITCLATTPPTCGWAPFYNVPRTIPLYVPAESVEAYKAADIWKEFDVQALSTDATLSSLTYDGMLVPFFEADTLHYTVDLPSETVAVPVVDAVANDPDAQVLIIQAAALPGEASVEVIAEDGTTRLIYTIYFSKKSTPTDISDRPDTNGTDSDKGAEKLLRNGQVLIIRNGKTHNMMGQRL